MRERHPAEEIGRPQAAARAEVGRRATRFSYSAAHPARLGRSDLRPPPVGDVDSVTPLHFDCLGPRALAHRTLSSRRNHPVIGKVTIPGVSYLPHTNTTLLTQNSQHVKVVQELLRHANSRSSSIFYTQAGMKEKREAQAKLCGWYSTAGTQQRRGTGLTRP